MPVWGYHSYVSIIFLQPSHNLFFLDIIFHFVSRAKKKTNVIRWFTDVYFILSSVHPCQAQANIT